MPNELNAINPKSLWQDQEVEKVILTVDEVRRRAAEFERRIHRRNLREYVVGVLVIALFTPQLWRTHGWGITPPALLIAGTIYVLFQLHRRAGARTVPADVGLRGSIEFLCVELERQRDALHGVWHWYLLPFVPGLAAGLVATGIDHGMNATLVRVGAFFVLVLAGIWALNKRGARRLDRRIRELRAMEIQDE
jgi:hypothetical protein